MSNVSSSALQPMLHKLERWHPFTDLEREAVLALPHTVRDLAANQYLVWEGDRPTTCALLVEGYAYRHKLAGNSARQILSIHMKGDLIDLQNSLLGVADHNVQMLTPGTVALVPIEAIREIALRIPAVCLAMWYESLVEASIFREWILNVGRRDARTAIAHLLCEFALRLEMAELGQTTNYELPITQEQLADAVGLTSVHVNRTLMRLEGEGYLRRSKRTIFIDDWQQLSKVADFDPLYLHLYKSDMPSGVHIPHLHDRKSARPES